MDMYRILFMYILYEFLDSHSAVFMHNNNILANTWIDIQYKAKWWGRPQPYERATYEMSHVRVWAIYSTDMHHILIILESRCAMYVTHDALQMHVIEWLLHKSARDK